MMTMITPSCTSLCPRTKLTAQFNTVETCLRCLHCCVHHNGPAAPVIFQQLRSNHCWNCCSPLRQNCYSSGLSLTPVWLQRVMSAAALDVSDNHKFERGLTGIRRNDLHWLDVPERVTFRLCVIVQVSTRHGTAILV